MQRDAFATALATVVLRYSLDCSKPYEKAVAYELLRSASVRPGSSLRYASGDTGYDRGSAFGLFFFSLNGGDP